MTANSGTYARRARRGFFVVNGSDVGKVRYSGGDGAVGEASPFLHRRIDRAYNREAQRRWREQHAPHKRDRDERKLGQVVGAALARLAT